MEEKIHFVRIIEINNEDNFEYTKEIHEYDLHGNLIMSKEFDNENNVIYENKYEYNDQNKMIIEDIISYHDDYKEKKFFVYDENGILESEKIEYDGGWYSIKKYERDVDNKTMKITSLDEENELEELIIIEYNDKGLICCQKVYDEDKKLKEMLRNEYNANGQILFKNEYDNKEKLIRAQKYHYTENDKILGIESFNHKGKILDWVKFGYNEDNDIINQLTMAGSRIEYSYDKENNIVVESNISKSGEMLEQTKTIKNEAGNILEEHSLQKVKKYVYEYF